MAVFGAELFLVGKQFNAEASLKGASRQIGFYVLLKNFHELEDENYSVLVCPIEEIAFLILILEQDSDWDGVASGIPNITENIRETLEITF